MRYGPRGNPIKRFEKFLQMQKGGCLIWTGNGTNSDNQKDAYSKQRRTAQGIKNGHAKLTPEAISLIRNDNRIQKVIASEYGICQTTVSAIKTGKAWPHV